MGIYQTDANRGILNLSDGKTHAIKIVVSDAFQNTNSFTFKLLSKKSALQVSKENFTQLFYYDRTNNFETEEVKVQFPEGTLYDQLNFKYSSTAKKTPFYSKIHQVHNQYVPVHKGYNLSIKTQSIPQKLQSKALIVSVSPTGKLSSIGGAYANTWVTAHPRLLGNFAVVLDTIPPKIQSLSITANKTLTNLSMIEFKISDNLSGIETYYGEIDGNWVLFEYDAKTDKLSYTIDKKRVISGTSHTLLLKVTDERKNSSVYKAKFYW
jgi:hypothetical protein